MGRSIGSMPINVIVRGSHDSIIHRSPALGGGRIASRLPFESHVRRRAEHQLDR